MKSVDPLTLLQPAAPTSGEAPQKGVAEPAAGFSAILAEANQQDVAAVPPQSKTSPEQPAALEQPANASDASAGTAASEQTTAVGPKAKSGKAGQPSPAIALPQQARSIHDSITRSTRGLSARGERPAAIALRSPAAPLFEQGAVTTSEPDGATPQVVADDPFALALGAEDPSDAASDPAALQAVLGQVASVITGIVVPPAQAAQFAPQPAASEGTRIGRASSEQALGAQLSPAAGGRETSAESLTAQPAIASSAGAAPVPADARVSPATAAFSDALTDAAPEAGALTPTQPGQPAQVTPQIGTAASAPLQTRFAANDRHHAQQSYGANTPATAQPRGAPVAREAGLPQGAAGSTPKRAELPPGAGVTQSAAQTTAAPSASGQPFAARTQPATSGAQGQPIAGQAQPSAMVAPNQPFAGQTQPSATVAPNQPFAGQTQPSATVAPNQPFAGQAQRSATVAQSQPFAGQAQPTAPTLSAPAEAGQQAASGPTSGMPREPSARGPLAPAAAQARAPFAPGAAPGRVPANAAGVDAVRTASDARAPAIGAPGGPAAPWSPSAPDSVQSPLDSAMPNAGAQGAPPSGRAGGPSVPPQTLPFAGTSNTTANAEPARAQAATRATPERTRDGKGEPQRQLVGATPSSVGLPEGVRNGQPSPALAPRGVAVAAPATPNLSTSGMAATPHPSEAGASATPNQSNASASASADPSASLLRGGASASGVDTSPMSASTGRSVPLATGSVALPKNELRPAVSAVAKAAPTVAPRSDGVRAPDSPVAQGSAAVAEVALPDAAAPAQHFVPQEQQSGVATSPLPAAVQPAATPAPVPAEQAALPSAVSASATTPSGASSGRPTLQAGKPNAQTDDRIHGFTRGALFGSAISAYADRTHGDASHDSPARGKHNDEQATDERSAKAEPVFTLDRPQPNDPQLIAVQLQAPPPDAPPMPQAVAAPVPVPAPAPPINVPEVVFAARPPGGQPEAASISIHHPDLGAIQLEVHRERGRVEVHAVIESVHAAAVLRANESGIRQGVQQSGMTFSALRVRVRGEEPQTARPAQARRRRADEREK